MEKSMGYSTGNFSKIGQFFKMAITRKFKSKSAQTFCVALVHQYESENVIKNFGDFGAIFWKKAWAIVQGIFQKLAYFETIMTAFLTVTIMNTFPPLPVD